MAPLRHLNKENCCQSLVISVGIKLQGDASVVLQKKLKKKHKFELINSTTCCVPTVSNRQAH